jgi:hypothetical protein
MVANLVEAINSSGPAEQEAVLQFVEFLQRKETPTSSPFLAAVEEFIERHPEVRRRLAQ